MLLTSSRECRREAAKRSREQLSDSYVRQNLAKGTRLRAATIPQPLVECKRAQLAFEKLERARAK